MVYTLILIISLKGQFHHDIDFKSIGNGYTIDRCQSIGNTLLKELKSINSELEGKVLCING